MFHKQREDVHYLKLMQSCVAFIWISQVPWNRGTTIIYVERTGVKLLEELEQGLFMQKRILGEVLFMAGNFQSINQN